MSQIIRALLELQSEEGWLPPARLTALAVRLRVPLHRIESVSTFYTHFRHEAPAGPVVHVCRDLSCRLAGSVKSCARLRSAVEASADRGTLGESGEPRPEIVEVSCLGRCDQAPAAEIDDSIFDLRDTETLLRRMSEVDSASADKGAAAASPVRDWPAANPYSTGALGHGPAAAAAGGARARADGALEGFAVLRAALAEPRETLSERLSEAGLRGMGGAGFPTGRKWSLVAAEEATPKHVICNADESEPGTFKDRELLADLPHLVIEGMLLAGYCVGASRGTVFIRHEYAPERRRLEAAIEIARAQGALGQGIFGSDFDFEIEVFVSPGGYILGEETALLECMEDRRGEPRNKPPFPGQQGFEGRPTLINNVETLVHAVGITHWGVDWWKGLGRPAFDGHKFISTSGDVETPGVELFSIGTPIAEVLAAHGGMKEGTTLGAFAPGGASSLFLTPDALNVPLDFDAVSKAGSMLGSGAMVFVAEGRDLLDVGLSIARFFRNESCGKCVPCRVGSQKAVAMVEAAGCVAAEDEALLRSLDETMKQTSICGLGQVALGPLLSILDRFPDGVRRVPENDGIATESKASG